MCVSLLQPTPIPATAKEAAVNNANRRSIMRSPLCAKLGKRAPGRVATVAALTARRDPSHCKPDAPRQCRAEPNHAHRAPAARLLLGKPFRQVCREGDHMLAANQVWALSKQSFKDWSEDKVPRLAAALAYYTAISLAPMLVLSVILLS